MLPDLEQWVEVACGGRGAQRLEVVRFELSRLPAATGDHLGCEIHLWLAYSCREVFTFCDNVTVLFPVVRKNRVF